MFFRSGEKAGLMGALPFAAFGGGCGTSAAAGIPESKKGSGACGARVQAAIGLASWAA